MYNAILKIVKPFYEFWLNINRRALGVPTDKLGFEQVPAIGRIAITSPAVMKPLEKINRGKKYRYQIKPHKFLVTCHVKPLGILRESIRNIFTSSRLTKLIRENG
jgi:hypothetical protein